MNTQHTPEPWLVSEYRPKNVLDSDGYGIVSEIQVARRDDVEQEANARRIVACVNACAGMKDPSAEINRMKMAVIDSVDQYSELEDEYNKLHKNYTDLAFRLTDAEQQRDELQAKCDFLVDELNELVTVAERCDCWESFPSPAIDRANAAIAKAQGVQHG